MKFLGIARDVVNSLKIGLTSISTVITGIGRIGVNITPASVAAATSAPQTFTVPGAQVGDAVFVTPPAVNPGVAPVTARVSAADTVSISFMNATAGALVPSAGVYQFLLIR